MPIELLPKRDIDDGSDEDPSTLPTCASFSCIIITNYSHVLLIVILLFFAIILYTVLCDTPTSKTKID